PALGSARTRPTAGVVRSSASPFFPLARVIGSTDAPEKYLRCSVFAVCFSTSTRERTYRPHQRGSRGGPYRGIVRGRSGRTEPSAEPFPTCLADDGGPRGSHQRHKRLFANSAGPRSGTALTSSAIPNDGA